MKTEDSLVRGFDGPDMARLFSERVGSLSSCSRVRYSSSALATGLRDRVSACLILTEEVVSQQRKQHGALERDGERKK